MKTQNNKMFNRIGKVLILLTAILFIANAELSAKGMPKQNSDTASFITITGKVLDKETSKPIMYANVFVVGSSIGTVANVDGEFLLKIPKDKANEMVGFSHLGYKNNSISVEKMKGVENKVVLDQEIIPLQEIIIRSDDPLTLIRGAIANIHKNYRSTPTMLTGFYREAIQQNKKYVSIAEAVLEAYKTSYSNQFADDKVKVLIGRKSQDVKKMDTVVVKLQGGPVTPFLLDVVKNPETILSDDYFKYYDYTLKGQTSLDNSRCYIIEFNERPGSNLALYKGVIYLEVQSLAIVGLEFGISEYGFPEANNLFVKRKPLMMRVDITGANYLVRYAKSNGYWNLNYVRSELGFKCKWKQRFFSSTYKTTVEMAVTDIDTTNINKFKANETIKLKDIFSEKADAFKNDAFWGDYNIIKPDESIQNAIEKLNKKLRKK
jgi:hypothetical protein